MGGGAAGGTGDGDFWVTGKANGSGGLQWGVRGLGALGDLGAEGCRGVGSVGVQGAGDPCAHGEFWGPEQRDPRFMGEVGTPGSWGRPTGWRSREWGPGSMGEPGDGALGPWGIWDMRFRSVGLQGMQTEHMEHPAGRGRRSPWLQAGSLPPTHQPSALSPHPRMDQ